MNTDQEPPKDYAPTPCPYPPGECLIHGPEWEEADEES